MEFDTSPTPAGRRRIRGPHPTRTQDTGMKRILGLGVGALWLVFSFSAFLNASAGRAMGAPDVAFWWGVIGSLLGIASLGAVGGTLIHTRSRE